MNLARSISFALSAALALAPALHAAQQQQPIVRSLGVTSLTQAQQRSAASTAQLSSTSARPHEALRPLPNPRLSTALRASAIQADHHGQASEYPVAGPTKNPFAFSGINTKDSNNANGGGTNGIVEPPDQGLAASDSQIFEAVNLAFRIFSVKGAPLSQPIDFNGFFGVIPTEGSVSNSLTDPRVFFDPQSRRFFLTILEYQTDANGAFLGSQDLLAVSQTSDATGNYNLYSIDVSNRSTATCTPGCLGDQPLIGVNDDGFYFSNNEFTNSATAPFAGVLITALDKQALLNNTAVHGTSYLLPADFTVEPALPAPGAMTTQHHGTEYFTESLDNGPPANGTALRIFALTNTETLDQATPSTTLSTSDFPTESYSGPVPANQKAGSYPLGQSLGDPEAEISTNDDRMLQLYYANGKLYTTLETQLMDPDAAFPRSGAAWFVIDPETTSNSVSAHVVDQGYIGIANGSVIFPAFAVNSWGDGVIGFSFSGTNYYPCTGYVTYNSGEIGNKVRTAGAGQSPEDGFTAYAQFGGSGVSRWGDYSAAVVSPNGHLWFAAEYIPNDILHPRTPYTNWGTFVARVQ